MRRIFSHRLYFDCWSKATYRRVYLAVIHYVQTARVHRLMHGDRRGWVIWFLAIGYIIACLQCYNTAIPQQCKPATVVIDLTKSLPDNPYYEEYLKMLYPTVRISTGLGTGSGVVIGDYILTAAHVVDNESTATIETFFPESIAIEATVLVTDTIKDLALIKPSKKLSYSAQLASDDYKPYLFHPVYAVGCSLGLKVRPSSGIISVIENTYWGISAPILPGNSGGPVFDSKTFEVIGISVWVNVYQGQLITTMVGVVPIQSICEFLMTNDQCLKGE
ncbi:MAG: serine protease [Planctomycetota bacterium]